MGILFILLGVVTLILTLLKLPFYWDSKKARRMRRLFGDSITTVIYVVIGLIISTIGILEILNIIEF